MKLELNSIRPHAALGFAIVELIYLAESPDVAGQYEHCEFKLFVKYKDEDSIAELSKRAMDRARALMSGK